ncbi:MAG TPA: biopolymer transporter ExbD [Humisphaera sp.]
MRTRTPKPVHYESGPNMTPLVDVVMVILIFLMLAGSFGSRERYMVTTLPAVKNGPASPDHRPRVDEPDPLRVYATVTREGTVRLDDGTVVTDLTGDLPGKLKAVLARNTAAGRKPAEVQLLISPRPDTEWEQVAPVYGAALKAEFTNIGFQATNR